MIAGKQNLAVYLNKHEVRHFGKPAIIATLPVMRAILQMASEFQIKEDNVGRSWNYPGWTLY